MTDLLEAASSALGTPRELVQRSAAARAAANGVSVDDILSSWAGDGPPPAPATSPAVPEQTAAESPEIATESEPAPEPVAAMADLAVPVVVVDEPIEPRLEEILEPVPLSARIKTAVRVGAWTGAALGVVGFMVGTAFWAPNATALPDSGPVVQVSPTGVIIAIALVSVVFGAIVAGMSRAATGWTDAAMQLSGSRAGTAWLGALIGLILGIVAGALLTGFGASVEGSDPLLIQLPVLTTLFVMVLGGAALGAATAMVPQIIGVPVAVDESDAEELQMVKTRLRSALSIPLAGLLLLALLVIPFGLTLIQSNELAPGVGGAIVAILTAGGILGFASLAGSRPQMKISFGDLMVALIGIGVVLLIIISVLFATHDEEEGETQTGEAAAIAHIL